MQEIYKLRGHEKNREMLRSLLQKKSAAGSYLFSGMEAVGKKKTAFWFAQLINCLSQNPPCGQCLSCRKIEKSVHPDVVLIERQEDKTVLTIDQIRDSVVSEAGFKPLEGRYKVFIINDAHLLNDQAQNSLLKLMEEPGEFLAIILVTSRPSELLGTVLSRCRNLRFFPLPQEELNYILEEIPSITPQKLHLILSTASGSPGRAVRQAGDEGFWKLRKDIITLLEKLPDGSLEDIIKFCDSFKVVRSDVERLESVFEIIFSWLRDLLFIHEGCDEEKLVNRDCISSLEKVVFCYGSEDILGLMDLLREIRRFVFENNLNIRLAMQRMFIKIKQTGSV